MQIRLQTLDHQQRALTALTRVFEGIDFDRSTRPEANVVFDPADPQIAHNIAQIQSGVLDGIDSIPRIWRSRVDEGVLGVDAKMETGTGKTLVYTQLMYELNRLYGFTKFIVLVPSTPIKEGTKAFMQSDYAQKYFADAYGGRLSLQLDVLDAQKRSSGRKMFPNAIASFVHGSRLSRGRISALLMTDGMLLSRATMASDYDQTVLGTASVPYAALRATRPIVIMDEPHRFRRENKAYQAIVDEIEPLAIFRFGATFPKLDKSGKTDYNNLVFNLGAVEAFNEQLVKGVQVQYPADATGETTRLKLTSLSARLPKQATFQNLDTGKPLTLDLGESLSIADGAFAGITIESIGKTEHPAIKTGVTLSNGQVLAAGDTLAAKVYSGTYQSLMMDQALKNHFEAEWANFRRAIKVKTLTLFFIDSIDSYRGGDNTSGHLRLRFEELLAARLATEIDKRKGDRSPVAQEYVAYLKASLSDVPSTNGGYFAADNSTADEAIAAEVDDILRNKEALLSFDLADGSVNTRRFLFSKWTLREGWDNPNVFQIVKLRSSGSEISKLQEVGRGLRLPVDSKGSRISGEQFYLTYLIDYTERSFADSLASEINSDVATGPALVKELLSKVAAELGKTDTELFIELLQAGLIDTDKNVAPGRENDLYAAYPAFNATGLKPDKIVQGDHKVNVGIRSDRYAELKELWETINAKYYLRLDDLSDDEVDSCVDSVLDTDVYRQARGRFAQDVIVQGESGVEVHTETKSTFDATETIAYGEWLKLAHSQTALPIDRIHAGLVRRSGSDPLPKDFFNKTTLGEFVAAFTEWMERTFLERFSYSRIDGVVGRTGLTDADGVPLESIVQGNIGIHRDDKAIVPETFLYDAFVYDSPKEHDTIRDSKLDAVIVFGKIPRNSIQIPLYFGSSTSPDFMYVLKRDDGRLSLNFIVETKDVGKRSDMRESEQLKMKAAKRFFESMRSDAFEVTFRPQVKRDDIVTLIQQVLAV